MDYLSSPRTDLDQMSAPRSALAAVYLRS